MDEPIIPTGFRKLERGEIKRGGDLWWEKRTGSWEQLQRTIGHGAATSELIIRPHAILGTEEVQQAQATDSPPRPGYGHW